MRCKNCGEIIVDEFVNGVFEIMQKIKCVVSDYEKRSPQQKIGNFTQTKMGDFNA